MRLRHSDGAVRNHSITKRAFANFAVTSLFAVLSACKLTESSPPAHSRLDNRDTCATCTGISTGTGSGTSTDAAADVWFLNSVPAVATVNKAYNINISINRKKSQYLSIQLQKTVGTSTTSIGTCGSYSDQTNSSTCSVSFTPDAVTPSGSPLLIQALVKFSQKSGDSKVLGQLNLDVRDGKTPDFSLSAQAPAKNPSDTTVPYSPSDALTITGSVTRSGSYQDPISARYEYSVDGARFYPINGCSSQLGATDSLPSCRFVVPDPLNLTNPSKQLLVRVSAQSGSLSRSSNTVALAAADTNLVVSISDFQGLKDRGEAVEFEAKITRKGSATNGSMIVVYQYALPVQSNNTGSPGNSAAKKVGDVAIAAVSALSWVDGSIPCQFKSTSSGTDIYTCKHSIALAPDQPYWAKSLNFRVRAIIGTRESISDVKIQAVGSPLIINSFTLSNPDISLPSENMMQLLGRTLNATVSAKSSTANNDPLKLTIRTQAGDATESDTECAAKAPQAQPKADSAPTDVTFNCSITLPNAHDKPNETAATQIRYYIARVTQGTLTPSLPNVLERGSRVVTAIDSKKGPFVSIAKPVPEDIAATGTKKIWFDNASSATAADYQFMVGATSNIEFYWGIRNASKADQCEYTIKLGEQTVDSSKGLVLVSAPVSSVFKLKGNAFNIDKLCFVARAKKQAGSSQSGDANEVVSTRIYATLYVYLNPMIQFEKIANNLEIPSAVRFEASPSKKYDTFAYIAPGTEAEETEASNWIREKIRTNFGTSTEPKYISATIQRYEWNATNKNYQTSNVPALTYCEGCKTTDNKPLKFDEIIEKECVMDYYRFYDESIENSKRYSINNYELQTVPTKTGKLKITASIPDSAQSQAPGKKIKIVYRTCASYNDSGNRYASLTGFFEYDYSSGRYLYEQCETLRERGCNWVDSAEPLEMNFRP